MQLMSWTLARLGSRFSLLFEPYQRRVMHSALGRFLDQPVDLMVGLIEPDGRERVLPFTTRGTLLYNCEQFERINSITFRGYSEGYGIRFECNVHSVFYPQNEELCTMPAFYLEMRLSPAGRVRSTRPVADTPDKVKLFIRIDRPDTQIDVSDQENGRIDLRYTNNVTPQGPETNKAPIWPDGDHAVTVRERIVSLNSGCDTDVEGRGLIYELPVTDVGSGIKWRLVWAAHCGDAVLRAGRGDEAADGRFRYCRRCPDIDSVVDEAIESRDDRLAHSRRFEKILDQVPLEAAQLHLINQSFQAFLGSTYWCDLDNGREWFSLSGGLCFFHSAIDVEYNVSMFYLSLWPRLLELQLDEWADYSERHEPSGGCILGHDMGQAACVTGQGYAHNMPVEDNANYLLLIQAYAHWTGDLSIVRRQLELLVHLAKYLIWTDRDGSGFPSEGLANAMDDASPAVQFARKQTYLAVKRLAALQAAADLLGCCGENELGRQCEQLVEEGAPKIDEEAWLSDHYVVCVDRSAAGILDVWTNQPLPYEEIPGWDSYSIYTGNGLLLPAMIGQPLLVELDHLKLDLANASRETLGRYGCGHSSHEPEDLWISQNLWRDHLARYAGITIPTLAQRYWDLQLMSNTQNQSLGFVDTYISNNLCFSPRGVTSLGYLLAAPRLVIDRLAPGGHRISVNPDRHFHQRWPLLPLADWSLGKVPVCVVDSAGTVFVEGMLETVIVGGQETSGVIG